MSIRFRTAAAAATILLCCAYGVQAQSTTTTTSSTTGTAPRPASDTESTSRLIAAYTAFAGSLDNAKALILGLESGSSVTLKPATVQPAGTKDATFTPATTKLSPGEVNIALSIAKAELTQMGITNPTPAQLQSALNGGTITKADGSTVTVKGVLSARASGTGWGQIANAMGFKLGALISASKTEHAGKKEHHEAAETHGKPGADTDTGAASSAARSDHAAAGGSSHGGGGGNGGGGGGHGGGGGKK